MFSKIVVAYNESPEAARALHAAIELARTVHAELQLVVVLTRIPSYAAYAAALDPSAPQTLRNDRILFYEALEEKARELARSHGLTLSSHQIEGRDVDKMVAHLRSEKASLLVIGLHQHDFYISRLWNAVFDLAQAAPCSILGVH